MVGRYPNTGTGSANKWIMGAYDMLARSLHADHGKSADKRDTIVTWETHEGGPIRVFHTQEAAQKGIRCGREALCPTCN